MDCIEFKNASFRYPNGTLANEELNLRIEQGERVAIIGQNGAGKTTAVQNDERPAPSPRRVT